MIVNKIVDKCWCTWGAILASKDLQKISCTIHPMIDAISLRIAANSAKDCCNSIDFVEYISKILA